MSRRAIIHGESKKFLVDEMNTKGHLYENFSLHTGFCIEGWLLKDEMSDYSTRNADDFITINGPILLEFYDGEVNDIEDYKVKRIIEDTNVILEKLLG